MKKTVKFFATICIIVLMSAVLFVTAGADTGDIAAFSVTDASSQNGVAEDISWFKASDGTYFIFLPSSADRSKLSVQFEADGEVMCSDTVLENGEVTDIFAGGDSFVLTCGEKSYNLRVLQSENEATIYVNTKSGNMTGVHNDKSHKEPGTIVILDENGGIEYNGKLDYIKGRGNSTWNHIKKPYNIKLEKKTDLFGMGKNKSWCLLANASEASMIRNQLAYDLAYNLGIDTTSPTRQVNLYLNGEYAGLYLLTEKVDIGENRIDIYDLEGKTEELNSKELDEYPLAGWQDSQIRGTIKYAAIPNNPEDITGGYLLELEKIYRYTDEVSGFITDNGQAVVVKTPEYASKAQVEYISGYYQDFEDALYSGTGYNSKGKHYSEYIDVDSLAKMYLMIEYTANFDGCSSSFYLWKDVGGKLTAGPAWDFDLSLGQGSPNNLINHVPDTADPHLLYAQTCFIGNHAENKKSLLAQAFTHNDFQAKVEEIWADEFVSCYPEFLENITAFSSQISKSFIMNSVRWNNYGGVDEKAILKGQNSQTDRIKTYAETRFAFLNEVYAKDTYFVKYDIGSNGAQLVHDKNIYKAGDTAKLLRAPETTGGNAEFIGWATNPDGSGQLYNAGDKITVNDNITLYAQWEDITFFNRILRSITDFFNSIAEFFRSLFGM